MQPWHTVESARAPDGTELVLARRGDEWAIRAAGHVLMSSRAHASEEALAAIALRRVARPRTVLLGGLGLGFTLRAALDRLPVDARAIVAELVPELVAWNRGALAELAGRPLDDPRVRLQVGDVAGRIAEARSAFDAILLDVDNGPSALVDAANHRLYGDRGVRACRDALRSDGVLAVWSASSDAGYRERLERAGFDVEEAPVAAQGSGGRRHLIFVASRGARSRPVEKWIARPPGDSRPVEQCPRHLSRGGAPTAPPAGRGGASPGYSARAAAPPPTGARRRGPTGGLRRGRGG